MARMTKARLSQYPHIKREIKQLEALVADATANGVPTVSDTVLSAAEFPYSPHTVVISGKDYTLLRRQQQRLGELKREKAAIEAFIEGVEDSQIRIILRYWLYEGCTWQAVSTRMGWQDRNTAEKKLKKFLAARTIPKNPHYN